MKNLTKLAMLALPAILLNASSCFAAEQKPVLTFNEADCKIHLIEGHAACEESQKVIEVMKKVFEAYGKHDINAISEYITEDCTGINEGHKLLVGKPAILDHIKKHIEKHSSEAESPLLSYTIERPFAQVNGDTATVTFVAYKSYGGKHPHCKVSHSTDIFVKRDGKWLASHYVNNWKESNKDIPVTTASTKIEHDHH